MHKVDVQYMLCVQGDEFSCLHEYGLILGNFRKLLATNEIKKTLKLWGVLFLFLIIFFFFDKLLPRNVFVLKTGELVIHILNENFLLLLNKLIKHLK